MGFLDGFTEITLALFVDYRRLPRFDGTAMRKYFQVGYTTIKTLDEWDSLYLQLKIMESSAETIDDLLDYLKNKYPHLFEDLDWLRKVKAAFDPAEEDDGLKKAADGNPEWGEVGSGGGTSAQRETLSISVNLSANGQWNSGWTVAPTFKLIQVAFPRPMRLRIYGNPADAMDDLDRPINTHIPTGTGCYLDLTGTEDQLVFNPSPQPDISNTNPSQPNTVYVVVDEVEGIPGAGEIISFVLLKLEKPVV